MIPIILSDFDMKFMLDYVIIHGYTTITRQGWILARRFYGRGHDYTTIARYLVDRRLVR